MTSREATERGNSQGWFSIWGLHIKSIFEKIPYFSVRVIYVSEDTGCLFLWQPLLNGSTTPPHCFSDEQGNKKTNDCLNKSENFSIFELGPAPPRFLHRKSWLINRPDFNIFKKPFKTSDRASKGDSSIFFTHCGRIFVTLWLANDISGTPRRNTGRSEPEPRPSPHGEELRRLHNKDALLDLMTPTENIYFISLPCVTRWGDRIRRLVHKAERQAAWRAEKPPVCRTWQDKLDATATKGAHRDPRASGEKANNPGKSDDATTKCQWMEWRGTGNNSDWNNCV